MALDLYQPEKPIVTDETACCRSLVLMGPTPDIVRHARVQGFVWPIGTGSEILAPAIPHPHHAALDDKTRSRPSLEAGL